MLEHIQTFPYAEGRRFQHNWERQLKAATPVSMNLGALIVGPNFGQFSFTSYLPLIAAITVSAIVGEIFHSARVSRMIRKRAIRRVLARMHYEQRRRQAQVAYRHEGTAAEQYRWGWRRSYQGGRHSMDDAP